MPDTDADFVHDLEKLCGSAFLLGMVHAEAEEPGKHIKAADDDIPPIPFSEAVNFLKSKVPLTKAEWKALEPKLHFRAFTVAKLGDAALIESAKQQLVAALEDGASYRETWERLKTIADTDALGIKPGYWENVFRTNTQSAYIAGKLQQYEGSGAVAYQLFVIEDSRTSRFCRNLLTNGRGLIIPVDHAFWKTYGFPPYHFQCRTSIRAIYASQVGKDGLIVDNPTMKSLARFKLQEGFGGNPLDNGNWWMMTSSQMEQAIKYGCLSMFNREENIFADYNSVWKGYTRHEGKNGGWYDLCKNPPDDWEHGEYPNKPVVEFLVENGYKVKVIPSLDNIKQKYNANWSNPDVLVNGFMTDIKTPQKLDSNGIKSRLKSALEQRVTHVVLYISDNMPESEIERGFKRFAGEKHSVVLKVLWIYKNAISLTEI